MTNLKLPPMDYRSLIERGTGKIAYETNIIVDGDAAKVFHHGNQIAILTPYAVILDNCYFHSRTTAHRLHEIARQNNVGMVCIRQGRMTFFEKGDLDENNPREMTEPIAIPVFQ